MQTIPFVSQFFHGRIRMSLDKVGIFISGCMQKVLMHMQQKSALKTSLQTQPYNSKVCLIYGTKSLFEVVKGEGLRSVVSALQK